LFANSKATEEQEARRVWHQTTIPVAFRQTEKGAQLLVRLPFRDDNRIWLNSLGKSSVDWNKVKKHWPLPKSWFNNFVESSLKRYGKLYVIQPYIEHEICAPACRDAEKHECQCSCMGANHGIRDGSGWFDVSQTFAIRFGEKRMACRLMQVKAKL
jgi:hypothetical protein